ncbi:hypothetical protein EDD25_2114 [Cryobacterium psychrophilum]|nr:hypothetical protein EDD25_2114 [Cryobacterium psychrophilum]
MMRSLRQVRRCIQQHAGADNASPKPSASSPHKCRLTHGSTELALSHPRLSAKPLPGEMRSGGPGAERAPDWGPKTDRGAEPLGYARFRAPPHFLRHRGGVPKKTITVAQAIAVPGAAPICARGPRDGVVARDIWVVIGRSRIHSGLIGTNLIRVRVHVWAGVDLRSATDAKRGLFVTSSSGIVSRIEYIHCV